MNWGLDGVFGKNLRDGYSDLGIPPQWDSATMGFRHHGLSPMASYIAPLGLIRGSVCDFRRKFFGFLTIFLILLDLAYKKSNFCGRFLEGSIECSPWARNVCFFG
jgi:hypothetical protein